jgi:hypothetical protein
VESAVNQAKVELNLEYQQKLSEAEQKARKTEHKLQEHTDRLRESKDAEIKSISNKLSVALNELRNRPKRPSSPPEDTGTTKACTGGELFREDAEFLTREAARADRVLVERDYYYSQYESVRRLLDQAAH